MNQSVTVEYDFLSLFVFHTHKDFDRLELYALFPPYMYFIFIYFVVIFYIYPELTTVNRSVKSPCHFENNVEKR